MRALATFLKWEVKALLFGQVDKNRIKAAIVSLLLALVLVVITATGEPPLKGPELSIWEKVKSAQNTLYTKRSELGFVPNDETDPWKTGLIGVEWSSITTTLGDLRAKRTSTDPRWAIVFYRWFQELGLKENDPVAILTSGSFPGFAISAIIAAEELNLDIMIAPSLGASSWGANVPVFPITKILRMLRTHGYMRSRPHFVTLGGRSELGLDLPPEGLEALEMAVSEEGLPLLTAESFEKLLELKWGKIVEFNPKVIVQIGGSQANMGTDPAVLTLKPGLIKPRPRISAGNGIIAKALEAGIPVIHVLNVRTLCKATGIPFDGEPNKKPPRQISKPMAVLGLILWSFYLLSFKRWSFEEDSSLDARE